MAADKKISLMMLNGEPIDVGSLPLHISDGPGFAAISRGQMCCSPQVPEHSSTSAASLESGAGYAHHEKPMPGGVTCLRLFVCADFASVADSKLKFRRSICLHPFCAVLGTSNQAVTC